MALSKISWTDYTFNPWIGCTKVSEGCKNCYAERENGRFKWNPTGWGPLAGRNKTSDSNWALVRKWNREVWWECSVCGARWADGKEMQGVCRHIVSDDYSAAEHTRGRVFCASLADVFEDRPDLVAWRIDLFSLIADCKNMDWMLLTKRPENVNRMILNATGERPEDWLHRNKHVWVGTSIENQAVAQGRLEALRDVYANVRFISCEPLIGELDLLNAVKVLDEDWDELNAQDDYEPEELIEECEAECDWINFGNDLVVNPEYREWQRDREESVRYKALKRSVDWVIAGGESGPWARPMHVNWVRRLRDTCEMVDIPFHFKQWGEWIQEGQQADNPDYVWKTTTPEHTWPDGEYSWRIGKKAAGRVLDGEMWNGYPNCGVRKVGSDD